MARLKGSRPKGPEPAPKRERPFLEIQYHPGDIRRRVRYFFLSRKQVVRWTLGGLLYLAFLVFGVTISVPAIRNTLANHRFEGLKEERQVEGEKLRTQIARLNELELASKKLLIDMSKVHLAYGISSDGGGTGGYPTPPPPDVNPKWIYHTELDRGHSLVGTLRDQTEALRVLIEEVRSFEASNSDQVRMTPSIVPLKAGTFQLTSPFGTRRNPFTDGMDFHAGIDLAAIVGTPIYAPADGTVIYAGRFPKSQSVAWWRYGNLVAIKNGERFMTLYGHCEEVKVKRGEKVEKGQLIATVGDTGWSTNPHLHYEIRWRDEADDWHPVDPRIYILDHRWSDEERMLIRARQAPSTKDYEPLPRAIGR